MKIRSKTSAISVFVTALLSAHLIQSSPADSYKVIENFQKKLFGTWLTRKASKKSASKIYSIKQEKNGNRYLHARSVRTSIQIAKRVNWKLKDYPVVSWKWRVHKLPDRANEAQMGRNDSAASIYVIFPRKKIPFLSWKYQPVNVIKYVWSASLPKGEVVKKKKTRLGSTIYAGRFIVLQTGNRNLGKWLVERRDVLSDYKMVFGRSPGKNPILIAILTDSNDTKSTAIADYDDITIRRE